MKHVKEYMKCSNACLAFGFFDGMHKGHESVIKTLVHAGKEKGQETVLLSFYVPEKEVFTTEQEKAYFAQRAGVDTFISIAVSAELKDLPPTDFIKDIFIDKLDVKTIVVGENLTFNGFDIVTLKDVAEKEGIEVIACKTETEAGAIISTELIEKEFNNSNFEMYTQLCNHPYVMIGVIEHGKALGRTVGMPTANLGVGTNKKMPKDGVFATVSIIDEEKFMGLTNIGNRPSVDNEDRITIETHILDFSKDIYDKQNILEVHFKIRGVTKFESLQEVQNQVQKDIDCSRKKLQVLFC